MIERLAANMAGQMAEERLIGKDQEAYYIYSITMHIEQFITAGTIFLISLLVGEFIPTLLFMVFFLTLRKRTGGFHFESFIKCYVGTVVAYIAIINIGSVLVNYLTVLLIVLFVAIGIIELIGTVNHPNMRMNKAELTESKKASRVLALLEGGVIYFLYYFGANLICISYMSIAVILCAALLCIAKIMGQEVKENEEG